MHYHWLSVFSVFSVVLLADLATPPAPIWGDIRVKHTWNTVPANWESLGAPPAGTMIDLHIALKPQRENALVDALDEVSNPMHQKYGAHLSKEQVAELVAPHQDTLDIVHSWLGHHGVPSSSISTSHGGGWLTITGVPVSQADQLLCASYQLYRHTETDEAEAILRTIGYSLPAVLHAHVQTVAPTSHFASPHTPLQTLRKRSRELAVIMNTTSGEPVSVLPRRGDIVTPSFLRWLYKTQAYVPAAMDQNAIGALGFQSNYPSKVDLTEFMTSYRADAKGATFTIVHVNGGGYGSGRPGDGASIITQYSEAMAYPTPYFFYNSGGRVQWSHVNGGPASGDVYLQWFSFLLTRTKIPPTISISYSNPEPGFPPAYAKALCDLFAQLGTRGVSVLVTSGDDGVGRGDCNDGPENVRFIPMFPASCPYVTSVGGTTGNDPEVAAGLSGGGFSLYFPRPSYQDGVLSPFLDFLGTKYAGLYRPEGRGIPDVAAQAQRFMYICGAVHYTTDSTVCSTSTVAGIVSLLNDYLLSNDRKPLGFLNPWLYSHGLGSLNDVMSGSNPGCNTDGFVAIPGWDPVTGLGTLDFEILQNILHDVDA